MDFLQQCKRKPYFLLHPLSFLPVTTLFVVQISISQAFQMVPACLLARVLPGLFFPFSFLFFRIFQVVPRDLESPSFLLVPSCHVVLLPLLDQGVRGACMTILSPGSFSLAFGGKSALWTRLPAEQTFSLDLQYLSGISCSNCLMISFLTSCIVMLTEVSFKTCLRFLGRMVVNCFLHNGTTVTGWISGTFKFNRFIRFRG